MQNAPSPLARPDATHALLRGVMAHFQACGQAVLPEYVLPTGRRADLMCLDKKGRMTICEIKSCREDFYTDTKWSSYLEFCDEFFFVVDEWFPVEILPENQGIIRADAFQAVILRQGGGLTSLAPARRKTLLQKFAFQAANRLNRMIVPEA